MRSQKPLETRTIHPAIPSRVGEPLGQSESFLAFQEKLSRAARVDRPVLLVGERGTGKELAAARLHFLSRRWQAPFVTLNCAALSPSLIESELFGYERGAFPCRCRKRSSGLWNMALSSVSAAARVWRWMSGSSGQPTRIYSPWQGT